MRGKSLCHPERSRGIVGVIGVDQQACGGTDRFPYRGNPLEVSIDAQKPDLHFQEPEPRISIGASFCGEGGKSGSMGQVVRAAVVAARGVGFDAVAECAAEQAKHGLRKKPACKVPKSDIERADGFDVGSLLAEVPRERIQFVPDAPAVSRICADQARSENVFDTRGHRLARAILSALAPSHEAIGGLDAQQEALPLGERAL